MNEKASEKNEMNSTAFAQGALQNRVAPITVGSIKRRITVAARELNKVAPNDRQWKISRVAAAWYADDRISLNADEMRDIERVSGLVYAQQEMRTNDQIIAQIDAFMVGHDADFYSAFRTAVRSFFGLPDRSGTAGDR
jgi:hypothetical protein